MTVTVKHERHQATANQQREQDTTRYGGIAVKRNFITADMRPGSGRKPDRQTQKREQWHDKEKLAHPVNIGRRGIRAMVRT